jgi:aspartyl-tRNA(Asn)/glutamyl-tRNA(Gln) amidotransferase subunit C
MAIGDSSKLSLETVKKVSHLARLKLNDQEIASVAVQLSAVLENFEQIAQVDTKGVIPLLTPTDIAFVVRKDVVEPFDSEKILAQAPDKAGRLFKVPPVV